MAAMAHWDAPRGGWGISTMVIAQSGYPFSIANYTAFTPTCATVANPYLKCGPGIAWTGNAGGDYNADRSNFDFSKVSSYAQTTSRKNWLLKSATNTAPGTIASGQRSGIAFGTAAEGNEKVNGFCGPGFFSTNASLMKDTTDRQSIKMQIRLDVFNLSQNSNFTNVDTNINDANNFAKALGALEPRWMQLGVGFKF